VPLPFGIILINAFDDVAAAAAAAAVVVNSRPIRPHINCMQWNSLLRRGHVATALKLLLCLTYGNCQCNICCWREGCC